MKISNFSQGPAVGEILCRLDDIEDGRAVEFSFQDSNEICQIFIHRAGEEVYAYENSCPHAYIPLNMTEGQFTERSGKYFMCQNHGALFEMTSGECVAGPCRGQSLNSVEIEVAEGNIIVC